VRSAWIGALALLLLGGAHAQTPEPLGVVLCVPASTYGEVKALNEGVPRHVVSRLHVTQAVFGSYRAQAVTVSIRPRVPSPGAPLEIRLPSSWVGTIQAMNPYTGLDLVSESNAFVAVRAFQSDQSYALSRTRFLMLPLDSLFALQQLNPQRTLTLAHSAQLSVSSVPIRLALVAIDEGNAAGLYIPQSVLPTVVLLNTNIRVVNPRLVFSGVPVATINVNAVSP
jgi:hypothetical protein